MDLPTYTSIFAFERRLYAVYDWELPAPVSLFQMGAFVAALVVTVVGAGLIGVELSPASAWVYVVPPAGAAWVASQPVADAKRPHAWLASQARYLGEARAVNRLRREAGPARARFAAAAWTPGARP